MEHRALRERVCTANKDINRSQLAILTWGNASEVDRTTGVFAIKPSGVDYEELTPADIPLVSLETGEKVAGELNPSSDTATHWQLYRAFETIGGIVHTHSPYGTAWAQARRPIDCLGTTHADTFYGSIPCTRPLSRAEIETEYELNTGKVIEEHFANHDIDPEAMPGVLIACHAPFAWAANAKKAVINAQILEEVAKMATLTLTIDSLTAPVAQDLLDKHHSRKHGKDAYYGQEKE